MLLERLIEGLEEFKASGNVKGIEITGIAYDSRKVKPGDIFVCIEGYKVDGHQFANDAVCRGASAILVSKDIKLSNDIPVIKCTNTRKALAEICCRFYDNPSRKINLIGVTGTKGKTTTTFMIKSILEKAGHKVGLIGTIANYIGDKLIPTEHTTPESLELQEMFVNMINNGVDTVVMEVSSHSLELYRVHGCDFKVGLFTNLSRDHLDFHLNFENYFAAKSKLFEMCKFGVINVDDQYGLKLKEKCRCQVTTFGIENKADVYAEKISIFPEGTVFKVTCNKDSFEVSVPIPGRFSVYNALGAIAACEKFKVSKEDIVEGLKGIKVPGRAEIIDTGDNFNVMVDYAHSPDSLENILKAVKSFAKGRVVVVFGCGGDRDRTKRPIMGEIAGKLADFTILTSDNPRSEEPEAIIAEIEKGIKPITNEYIIIPDRQSAIEYAIKNARENDFILIAGKGHETYQIFKDKTIHFDDREVAKEAILKRKKGDVN